jgi:hypothetical protein
VVPARHSQNGRVSPPAISASLTTVRAGPCRTGVGQILAEEGFGRLLRGPAAGASTFPATGAIPACPRAGVIGFGARPDRLDTRLAGLLLVIPDLVALDLPALVSAARYPGTRAIPPASRPAGSGRGKTGGILLTPRRAVRARPARRVIPNDLLV